jgi:hypothetical protein
MTNICNVNQARLKLANPSPAENWHGWMIHSVHPALVPRQGAMSGSLLFDVVYPYLGLVGPRQDMLPGEALLPTTGPTIVAHGAHQVAIVAGMQHQFSALGDRSCIPVRTILLGVCQKVARCRIYGLGVPSLPVYVICLCYRPESHRGGSPQGLRQVTNAASKARHEGSKNGISRR